LKPLSVAAGSSRVTEGPTSVSSSRLLSLMAVVSNDGRFDQALVAPLHALHRKSIIAESERGDPEAAPTPAGKL
jgi:hypothetical protein